MDYPQLEHAKSSEALQHKCGEHLELRERRKGDGTSYGYQCQFCGQFKGGEVSKKKVFVKPIPYDSRLEVAYRNKYQDLNNSLSSNREAINTSLITHKSRDYCLELDKVISNFCDQNQLNKNAIFKSYLTRQRDRYITNEFDSNWENEEQLHSWLVENLSEHFEIYREVQGYGFINRQKRNVRIDFVLKAKLRLIEHGFTNQYIGVEVKYFSPKGGKGFHGKSSSGVFQALSYWYSGARWSIPYIGDVELATVLMFSNLSFQDEANLLFDTLDSHYKKTWKAYLSIANHANVGELLVRTKEGQLCYWGMEYNGSKYYSMNNNGEYIKGNPNVINKKRIGNSSA